MTKCKYRNAYRTAIRHLRQAVYLVQMELDAAGWDEVRQDPILHQKHKDLLKIRRFMRRNNVS
jgi:hypothetical protein